MSDLKAGDRVGYSALFTKRTGLTGRDASAQVGVVDRVMHERCVVVTWNAGGHQTTINPKWLRRLEG